MSTNRKVLVFAGSTRVASLNRKLALAAAEVASELGAQATHLELKEYPLPLYDGDHEATQGSPQNVSVLRNLLKAHDVWLIASPDYNSSIAPVLKNLIDWVSRPCDGEDYVACFKGRTVGVMSSSPGSSGGARGLPHLRQVLTHLGANVLAEQFTVPRGATAFSDNGHLAEIARAEHLHRFVSSALAATVAATHIERVHAA